MSRKYTDSTLSASANPEANTASRTDVSTTTGSHGRNGLPAISRTTQNSAISMANCTHACSTLEKTSTSRGKATRRTSPALPEIELKPEVVDEGEEVPRQETAEQVVGESVEAARVTDRGLAR